MKNFAVTYEIDKFHDIVSSFTKEILFHKLCVVRASNPQQALSLGKEHLRALAASEGLDEPIKNEYLDTCTFRVFRYPEKLRFFHYEYHPHWTNYCVSEINGRFYDKEKDDGFCHCFHTQK